MDLSYFCTMSNALIEYLRSFITIPDEDAAIIADHVQHRIITEGETLLQEGSIAREMFFICKGILKIVSTSDKGVEIIHFFVKEKQFCTILNSFNKELPAGEGIKAACDAEILVFTRSRLQKLYQQLPYIQALIEQITHQRLLDKIQVTNMYLGKDSTSKYKLFIEQQSDIAVRVPLTDIASYLGITPQSLSRIRKNNR